MGSIPGVILGSIVLKGLPEMLRELDIYRLMVFGALLVVMMIIRPEGLMPAKSVQLEQRFEPDIPKRVGGPDQVSPEQSSGGSRIDDHHAPDKSGGSHDSLS